MDNVVIVGGGLAGLAAAAALGSQGVKTTLLESRPRLGGRASSFQDQTTGGLIDNCQHVSMGCCTNFQKFCELVGIADRFRTEETLYFIAPDGVVNRFSAGSWPAPLHLAGAFQRLSYLNAVDRRALARGLKALAAEDVTAGYGKNFADWLREHRQTEQAIRRFWHVVLVSALSEDLDRISVSVARKVFVDAFLTHREGWKVQIPTAPLDELYGQTIQRWLHERGVSVRLLAGVKQLIWSPEHNQITGVELRNGESLSSSRVILAVPHHRVQELIPEPVADRAGAGRLAGLESAPISSVHFWFDREVTELPHAVLIDRLSQWVFNRSALQGYSGDSYSYQVVISASRNLQGRSQAEIIEEVRRELSEIWPAAKVARVLHARLVTEHKAVFAVGPDTEQLRPPQRTSIAGLYLAGDYTRTGWPATMEGAVRSGFLAAQELLADLGQAAQWLAPDLPRALLSRWLLGL